MEKVGTLCITFDNMGMAREIGEGKASKPDPDEPGLKIGYPRVLQLLDELGLRGTFFIEGWNGLHHPDRVVELVERGHEVGLHGWVHEKFSLLSKGQAEQILYDGTAAFDRLGIRPRGFRSPGGARGPHAIEVLTDLGYSFDSSIDHDQLSEVEATDFLGQIEPRKLGPSLVNIPWRWSMVDVIQYRRLPSGPKTPEQLETAWLEMIDRTAAARTTMTLIIHPYMSGTDDARFSAIGRILKAAVRRSDLEIVSAGQLADAVMASTAP